MDNIGSDILFCMAPGLPHSVDRPVRLVWPLGHWQSVPCNKSPLATSSPSGVATRPLGPGQPESCDTCCACRKPKQYDPLPTLAVLLRVGCTSPVRREVLGRTVAQANPCSSKAESQTVTGSCPVVCVGGGGVDSSSRAPGIGWPQ
jgi:hypothetical protein